MEQEKSFQYKIGYVPGVYDLFHVGHLRLIQRAKALSEHLIVGVLSDELVEHFKGKRPYIPAEERMEIVGALKEVDEVVLVDFDNTVKMDAWKLYHFDAYFSGSDHGHEWDDEKRALQAVGSDIVFFPYTMSTSSTAIKQQIRKDTEPKRVYLFGAGQIGQRILKELSTDSMQTKWKVEGFLDNSVDKHLTRISKVPVYLPEDLATLEDSDDYSVIITMKKTEAAINQLNTIGVSNILSIGDVH